MSKRHRPGKKQKRDWIQDLPKQDALKKNLKEINEIKGLEIEETVMEEPAMVQPVDQSIDQPVDQSVNQENDSAGKIAAISIQEVQKKTMVQLAALKADATSTLQKAKDATSKQAMALKERVQPALRQMSAKLTAGIQRIKAGASSADTVDTANVTGGTGVTGENQGIAAEVHQPQWTAMLKTFFGKTPVKLAVAGIALAAIAAYAGSNTYNNYQESLTAYELTLDGQILGIVRDADEAFNQAVNTLQREMRQLYGMEAYIPDTREWLEVKATDEELTTQAALITALKNQLGIKVKATALAIDGEPLVILPSLQMAENLLEQIMEPYLDPEVEYLETGFSENYQLMEVVADLSDIWDMEEALQYLQTGTDEIKIHVVQPGESTWLIARQNDMTVEEIEAANPGLVSERLSIGQELNLIVPTPYLTVRTLEYAELAEPIPFETEEVESESLYQGDRRITTQGEEGFRELKAYIVRENGREADRDILEENRLSDPTTRVVAVGTKPRPATMATGTFMNPTRGRLTSPFGMRGGSRHTGIDIANSRGTEVKAADAGKVSFAGTRGAYGQLIIIDHENGYQTYYAHLNSMSVSAGTRVHKDQLIGTIGTTGRTTGPHLHFEVRKNGTPVNPLGFVNY